MPFPAWKWQIMQTEDKGEVRENRVEVREGSISRVQDRPCGTSGFPDTVHGGGDDPFQCPVILLGQVLEFGS